MLVGASLSSVQARPSAPAPAPVTAAPAFAGATESSGAKARKIDTSLIEALKSKDHTAAVKKIRIKLVSAPAKTVWTSTRNRVSIPMQWSVTDPKRVAKRIRVCAEDILLDDDSCGVHNLRNYRTPRGDFWMKRTKAGWAVFTAPYYKKRSRNQCTNHEYYRPKIRWTVSVVDPRNGRNAVTGKFGWTLRCSG